MQEVLSPYQVEVITKRYGLDGEQPKSWPEIAREYGVSDRAVAAAANLGLKRLGMSRFEYVLMEFLKYFEEREISTHPLVYEDEKEGSGLGIYGPRLDYRGEKWRFD